MTEPEHVQTVILGSGQGGKLLAWHLARTGRRTAVVERQWIGGSCPNVACLPSKNEIWSARVGDIYARHASAYGAVNGAITTDMVTVRQRKRAMVDREVAFHLDAYKKSDAELIMGTGLFCGPEDDRSSSERWRDAPSRCRSDRAERRNACGHAGDRRSA